MSKRLPSLNALRVFIAVVRHGGVSRAAEALHLTHSAVSHQIRTLQDELGVTLFDKNGRGLTLSGEAEDFAARVEAAFKEIEEATHDITSGKHRRLRISTIPSFAARWLLPRLGDFVFECPDVDVEVQSSLKLCDVEVQPSIRLADIKGGEIDIAIRFGTGNYPGLFSERLMRDWLFPVCSPGFARDHHLGDPPNIEGVPLLHSDQEPWSWWFQEAGIVAEEPQHGILFNDSALMLQAAANGQGLCLARQSLAYEDVAAGRLMRPFSAFAESPNAYYFVCRKDKLESDPIARFRRWIKKQIESYPILG